MRRQTQNTLYHLLPVAFWLLATGVVVVWELFFNPQFSIFHYVPSVLVWAALALLHRIGRHTNSVEQCFQIALLLGVAAYWLPSAVFLILPAWGYLIYRNLFSLRAFFASLIGLAFVAVWVWVLSLFALPSSILPLPFSISNNLSAWLPTGAVLFAWIASTIARQTLRVR